MKDPVNWNPEPLREQVKPYRKYGDSELALSLLHFQKREESAIKALCKDRREMGTFEVRSQPADVGFDYYCPDCEENVRAVTKPESGSLMDCPLCGETPGALELGRGTRE